MWSRAATQWSGECLEHDDTTLSSVSARSRERQSNCTRNRDRQRRCVELRVSRYTSSISLTRACLLSEVIDFAHVSPGTEVYRWNAQIRQVTHSADLTDFLPQNPPKAFQNHISNNKISSIIALTFDPCFDDLERDLWSCFLALQRTCVRLRVCVCRASVCLWVVQWELCLFSTSTCSPHLLSSPAMNRSAASTSCFRSPFTRMRPRNLAALIRTPQVSLLRVSWKILKSTVYYLLPFSLYSSVLFKTKAFAMMTSHIHIYSVCHVASMTSPHNCFRVTRLRSLIQLT